MKYYITDVLRTTVYSLEVSQVGASFTIIVFDTKRPLIPIGRTYKYISRVRAIPVEIERIRRIYVLRKSKFHKKRYLPLKSFQQLRDIR